LSILRALADDHRLTTNDHPGLTFVATYPYNGSIVTL